MKSIRKNRQPLVRADKSRASACPNRCPPASLTHRPDVDFYSRLQRIWHQVLTLEDRGMIHNELEKFAYAYRLIEAELQHVSAENTALYQTLNEQKNRILPP